jgi:aminoglycoside 3-N-acetyltransferase
MGRLADLLWRRPSALRSAHPAESVAAIGPRAPWLVKPHPLEDPMGPRSPWARLVELDARVVLVGVGFERCSILHHAERMAEPPYLEACAYTAPIRVDGARRWVEVESGAGCSEGFRAVEPPLRAAGAIEDVPVGEATAHVASARVILRAAREMLSRDALALLCPEGACASCNLARAVVAGMAARGEA